MYFSLQLIKFVSNFQVYKIANLKVENKSIYIAGSSLYELIKNETEICLAAQEIKTVEIETQFNAMAELASKDYDLFKFNLHKNSTQFQREVMVNFSELFELVIDIKKRAQSDDEITPAEGIAEPDVISHNVTDEGEGEMSHEPTTKRYRRSLKF